MTPSQKSYKRLVAHFGGQQKTAAALGCTQPSVWAWLQGNAYMSAVLALKAEREEAQNYIPEKNRGERESIGRTRWT